MGTHPKGSGSDLIPADFKLQASVSLFCNLLKYEQKSVFQMFFQKSESRLIIGSICMSFSCSLGFKLVSKKLHLLCIDNPDFYLNQNLNQVASCSKYFGNLLIETIDYSILILRRSKLARKRFTKAKFP